MNVPKRKFDSRGVDKGYPKRVQKKYGSVGNGHNENISDKLAANSITDITMSTNPLNESSIVPTMRPSEPSVAKAPELENIVTSEKSPEALERNDWSAPPATEVNITEENAKTGKPEKAEKRPEPQTPAEFIESFYKGRTKSLTESIVRRMKGNGLAFDAGSRGAILRLAQSDDETLDKTRKLMLIASEETDLKPFGDLLMGFSVDVICLHKSIQTNGIRAKLFPNYSDESVLEDGWNALSSMKQPEEDAAMIELQVSKYSDTNEQEKSGGNSQIGISRKGKGTASGNALASLVNKARRNAFLCSVIWRIHRKHSTFSEAMRAMRNTIFRAPTATGLETELLEAIALMPEKEDSRVALLLEWQAKQQLDISAKLVEANQCSSNLTSQLAQVKRDIAIGLETIAKLEQDLVTVRLERQHLQSQIGVVQTHGQADHEALRSLSLRVVRDSVNQLESVTTALGRDPPKVAIAVEVLNTVTDALRQADKKLGET